MTYTNNDLTELKMFFDGQELPAEIRLNSAEVVRDVPHFIESHLITAAANIGIAAFSSFYDRLMKAKEILEAKANKKSQS